MPSKPRKDTVDPQESIILHCYARCTRQLWLLADEDDSPDGHPPRRIWVQELVSFMARVFAVEIGFLAQMSNHYHLVIRNRPDIVGRWSDEAVIYRWVQASHLTKSLHGELREPTQKQIDKETRRCKLDPKRINKLRRRLADPSEFMKCLNENLARRINRADSRTGHVWESRFEAKPILGEAALAAVAIYVDLNQIRAGEVDRIEQSRFSSVFLRFAQLLDVTLPADDRCEDLLARIQSAITNSAITSTDNASASLESDRDGSSQSPGRNDEASNCNSPDILNGAPGHDSTGTSQKSLATHSESGVTTNVPKDWHSTNNITRRAPRGAWLSPLQLEEGPQADPRTGQQCVSPWRLTDKGWLHLSDWDYLLVLDWTARELRPDKRGSTPADCPPLFERIGIRAEHFVSLITDFRKSFRTAIGTAEELKQFAEKRGKLPTDLAAARTFFTA